VGIPPRRGGRVLRRRRGRVRHADHGHLPRVRRCCSRSPSPTARRPNLTSLTIAIAITWWPWYTRLVRGQAASVAGRPYVEACRALGIPSWRILLRHVLPNSVTPVIVQVSLDVGG